MSTKAGMSMKDSHRFSLHLVADGSVSIKTLTFRHVMKDPLGREYFMKFLRTEHAEENLVFFDEVENFKATKLKAAVNIKEAVEEMVATYLMPGVEAEVNISDQMKRNLLKAATNDVEQHLDEFLKHLDKAQNEIMMILAMGAFPRFLKSKFFIQYKIKAKEMRDQEEEDEVRTAEGASA
jgi:hypothetical protein